MSEWEVGGLLGESLGSRLGKQPSAVSSPPSILVPGPLAGRLWLFGRFLSLLCCPWIVQLRGPLYDASVFSQGLEA